MHVTYDIEKEPVVMTMAHVAVPDADAEGEVRWLEWKARGLAQDRRTAAMISKLTVPAAIVCASWVVAQLIKL